MNFLAHLYLSGDDIEIRLGNFIGDYVKGNHLRNYPTGVQAGIRLHRAIDHFTDNHNIWKECREILRPSYDRWSGVATDVMLDHILAREWASYSNRELKGFTRTFYFQLLQRYHMLPARVRGFLPFMVQSNRLYSYSNREGIIRALEIMGNHTTLRGNPHLAIELVYENYSTFSTGLRHLITDLSVTCSKYLESH